MKKVLKVAVILVVLLLIFLPFLAFMKYATIAETYSYFVNRIADLTGFNTYLINVGVALWLVPLWFGLKWFLTPSIPFRKLPWYKKRRNWGASLLFVMLLGWNLALYGFTKDQFFAFKEGATLKWYVLTPEGVKFFDRPGVDPVYGIALKPVTPEVVRELRLLGKGEFKPIDPRTAMLFNPITHDVQAWYYKSPDGTYEFYDKPGFHPKTGAPLKPVTTEAYSDWQSSIAPKSTSAPVVGGGLVGHREGAGGNVGASLHEARLSELRSLVNRGAVPQSAKPKVAIVIEGASVAGLAPEESLCGRLSSDRITIIGGYLKEGFKRKGYFRDAFAGQTDLLRGAGALDGVDYIILGKVDSSFRKGSPVDPNMVSCTVRLSYEVVNKAGAIVARDSVSVVGPGFSEDDAYARGLEMLADQYGTRILGPIS